MNRKKWIAVFGLSYFMPSVANAAITEEQFHAGIDAVLKAFAPVAKAHGATLAFDRQWESDSEGGMSYRSRDGKTWVTRINGEPARFPSATYDSFMITLCHEIGHQFAGYPFYAHDAEEWAAAEGQADYWASQACLKRLWKGEVENNARYANVQDSGCENVYSREQELNLCKRIYRAIDVESAYEEKVGRGRASVRSRDGSEVSELFVGHPKPQCRVDSLLQGLWCNREFNFSVIPGRLNPLGQNTVSSEQEARQSSCFASDGFDVGTRPRCWFSEANLTKAPETPPVELHKGDHQ